MYPAWLGCSRVGPVSKLALATVPRHPTLLQGNSAPGQPRVLGGRSSAQLTLPISLGCSAACKQ